MKRTPSEKKLQQTPRIIHADSHWCILVYIKWFWSIWCSCDRWAENHHSSRGPLMAWTFVFRWGTYAFWAGQLVCNIDGKHEKSVLFPTVLPKKNSGPRAHFWKWLHWKICRKEVGNLNLKPPFQTFGSQTGSQSWPTSQVQLMVALWKLSSTRWLGKNMT